VATVKGKEGKTRFNGGKESVQKKSKKRGLNRAAGVSGSGEKETETGSVGWDLGGPGRIIRNNH